MVEGVVVVFASVVAGAAGAAGATFVFAFPIFLHFAFATFECVMMLVSFLRNIEFI